MSRANSRPWWLAIASCIALVGCDEDERLAKLALETSAQQAEQNQELAHLNREVAEGTRRLIDSRGQADELILDQQQQVQTGRDQLEAERRSLASQRNRESLFAAVLVMVGSLVVTSLPLILCWYLLHQLGPATTDAELTQLLLEQLAQLPDADANQQSEKHAGLTTSDRCGAKNLRTTDSASS